MANIGSLTADLRLQSAAFIRDLGKASAAVAANTSVMRRQLTSLSATATKVGSAFGAWLTVRSARRVITFLDQSIDLAAKLDNELGRAAQQWNRQGEEMRNAFQLGVAQGFLDQVAKGLADSTASLEGLAKAGIVVGNALGAVFAGIVKFLVEDIPNGINQSIAQLNSFIASINSVNEALNNAVISAEKFFGISSGRETTTGNIPSIEPVTLDAQIEQFTNFANVQGIVANATNLTTEAINQQKEAAASLSESIRQQQALYESIQDPLEQYKARVQEITAIQANDEVTTRALTAAKMELGTAALDIVGNVANALSIAFKENKGIAIAEVVINTAQAIMKTFAQYGFTPWGIAAAASMAAVGAAQIASIASAEPGNTSKAIKKSGGGGRSASSSSAPARAGEASRTSTSASTVPGQAINITLQGEGGFSRSQVRALIGQINEAVGDGAMLRVSG